MKVLLITLLFSFSAFSQDSRCLLELTTLERDDMGIVPASKHQGFMQLLDDKGYDVTVKKDPDWNQLRGPDREEVLERLNNRISLRFLGFTCIEESKNVSINIGPWSWGNKKDKWSCPLGPNIPTLKAVSEGEVHEPTLDVIEYFRKSDPNKTYKTREEAEGRFLKAFQELIPSCDDLKSKYPEVGAS